MKKILLLAAVVLASTTLLFANEGDRKQRKEERIEKRKNRQELRRAKRAQERDEVGIIVRGQFADDFPSAKQPVFSKSGGFSIVTFMQDQKLLKAYYDTDNELVGTTRKLAFTRLPDAAQKKILKEYPDYTVASVIKFEDNEDNADDMILYNSAIPDDGYFVEVKKDNTTRVLQVTLSGDVNFFKDL